MQIHERLNLSFAQPCAQFLIGKRFDHFWIEFHLLLNCRTFRSRNCKPAIQHLTSYLLQRLNFLSNSARRASTMALRFRLRLQFFNQWFFIPTAVSRKINIRSFWLDVSWFLSTVQRWDALVILTRELAQKCWQKYFAARAQTCFSPFSEASIAIRKTVLAFCWESQNMMGHVNIVLRFLIALFGLCNVCFHGLVGCFHFRNVCTFRSLPCV